MGGGDKMGYFKKKEEDLNLLTQFLLNQSHKCFYSRLYITAPVHTQCSLNNNKNVYL
jgi:hypothetical protein